MCSGIWGALSALPKVLNLIEMAVDSFRKWRIERRRAEIYERKMKRAKLAHDIGKAKTDEERSRLIAELNKLR